MTIKELQDKLYLGDTPVNPKLFVKYYEANLDLINSVDLTNVVDYGFAMRMTCDYAMILENSGNLLKGIMFLDEAIEKLENYPDYQKDRLFEVPYYELVFFHKARAFYNLRNFRDSLMIFERLHKVFPHKEQYKAWILRITAKKYQHWVWNGLGVMLVTLILRIFLEEKVPWMDEITYWILLLALVCTATFEIGKWIKLKKLKRIHAL